MQKRQIFWLKPLKSSFKYLLINLKLLTAFSREQAQRFFRTFNRKTEKNVKSESRFVFSSNKNDKKKYHVSNKNHLICLGAVRYERNTRDELFSFWRRQMNTNSKYNYPLRYQFRFKKQKLIKRDTIQDKLCIISNLPTFSMHQTKIILYSTGAEIINIIEAKTLRSSSSICMTESNIWFFLSWVC